MCAAVSPGVAPTRPCDKAFKCSCGEEWSFGRDPMRLVPWLVAKKRTRRKRIRMNVKITDIDAPNGRHALICPCSWIHNELALAFLCNGVKSCSTLQTHLSIGALCSACKNSVNSELTSDLQFDNGRRISDLGRAWISHRSRLGTFSLQSFKGSKYSRRGTTDSRQSFKFLLRSAPHREGIASH